MGFCTVRWSNHSPSVKQCLEDNYAAEKFTDVAIASNSHILKAHKVILAGSSSYFENIFTKYDVPNMVVAIEEVSYPILKLVLDFIYKGEIDVDLKDLQSLLTAGVLLKVRGLEMIKISDILVDGRSTCDQHSPQKSEQNVDRISGEQSNIPSTIDSTVEESKKETGRETNLTPTLSKRTDSDTNMCHSPFVESVNETASTPEELSSISSVNTDVGHNNINGPESSDSTKTVSATKTYSLSQAIDERTGETIPIETKQSGLSPADTIIESDTPEKNTKTTAKKLLHQRKKKTSNLRNSLNHLPQVSEQQQGNEQQLEDGMKSSVRRLSRPIKKPARIAELEFTSINSVKRKRVKSSLP